MSEHFMSFIQDCTGREKKRRKRKIVGENLICMAKFISLVSSGLDTIFICRDNVVHVSYCIVVQTIFSLERNTY